MLKYNFERIFRIRGIERPFTYLQQAGFSDQFASRVKNDRVARLNMRELERLCILLHCTPNDLMEWIPEPDTRAGEDHPLRKLKDDRTVTDIVKTLHKVPLEQVKEIEKMIKEKIGKQDQE